MMAFSLEWQMSWWQISQGGNFPAGLYTGEKIQAEWHMSVKTVVQMAYVTK